MKRITVYTPTYNRAYTLPHLYNSLLRQSNSNFKWIIVDDGSTDNTNEIVNSWIKEGNLEIQYIYQTNKGRQQATNLAESMVNTELCVCIDSDDYMTDNAINIILDEWDKVKQNDKIAGLIGLDIDKNGEIIGTPFPTNIAYTKFTHFAKYHIKGDKKFVYRTDVIKKYPQFPYFEGEKMSLQGYLYRLIDQDYYFALLNIPLCVVEYLPDGMTKNKFSHYKKYPRSFSFYRKERMRLAIDFKDKYRNAVHLVSSCLFAKENLFRNNPYKLITLLSIPFGILLHLYINIKIKIVKTKNG